MTRLVGTKLTPDVARELCQRADNKAYIAGAIGSLGSEYVLGLKAVNCRNGDTLAEEQVTAASKEKVLDALGKAASEMRGELGESLAKVQKFDVPLEQVTTSSLEALRAYSLGEATYRKNELPASIPFFQRAFELDPTFSAAYAKLGAVYGNLGETTKAAANITKAFELRDRLSERERFYLSGHYYDQITGDLEKAAQIYQLWAKTYPREPAAVGNLAHNDFQIGRYDEALSAAQKCVRLAPSGLAYPILLASYLFLNRFDEAKATAAEAESQHFDSYSIHLNLYLIAFVQGDPPGMAREAAAAKSTPGHEDTMLSYEALTADDMGELAKARDLSRRASDFAQRGGSQEAAASYLAEAALQEALVGNAARGRQGAATALAISQGKSVKETAALA
jgi:tetratricopeptide (TPR) repeat protein